MDPHYLILIVTLIIYMQKTVKERIMTIAKTLIAAAIFIGYLALTTGYDAYKSIYLNLLFISGGNESMSMVWYFYILCFKDYLNAYRFLLLLYPYCTIIPTVINVKLLEGSFNSYSEMPIDKNNALNTKLETYIEGLEEKPEKYKKFLVQDEANFDVKTVKNYHMTM